MKKEKKTTELKLTLHRETLRALEPPELAHIVAGVTVCLSGRPCVCTTVDAG